MTLRPILSLLLALVLALTSVTSAVARGGLPGITMVICTGTDVQTVTLDASGAPAKPSHPCPDCLSLVVAGLLPQPFGLLAPRFETKSLRPLPLTTPEPVRATEQAARDPPNLL